MLVSGEVIGRGRSARAFKGVDYKPVQDLGKFLAENHLASVAVGKAESSSQAMGGRIINERTQRTLYCLASTAPQLPPLFLPIADCWKHYATIDQLTAELKRGELQAYGWNRNATVQRPLTLSIVNPQISLGENYQITTVSSALTLATVKLTYSAQISAEEHPDEHRTRNHHILKQWAHERPSLLATL